MIAITIIGAGPVGLKTGILLKREGFDVSVFEEHPEIGVPVNCGGLVSKRGIDALGIELQDCLVNQVRGAKIYSPSGTEMTVKKKDTVAYVINRAKFDQQFYKTALKAGLDVRLRTKLINVRGNSVFMESHGRGEMEKSKIIIGADGANSTVRHIMSGNTNKENFIHTMQATAEGNFDRDFVSVYFGDFAKGFFGWIIPENEQIARIGIGTALGENVSESFEKFLRNSKIEAKILETSSFLIPVSKPLSEVAKDNLVIVGDAAFQTKATTGGGLITGLTAANICAKSVSEHFKRNAPLKNYNTGLKELNKELLMHWKVHSYLKSQDNRAIDKLFLKLKKAGIEEFLSEHGDMDMPSRFLGKMAANPKYWFMLGPLMGFLRS